MIDVGTIGAGQLRVLDTSVGQEVFPAVPKMTKTAETPGFPLDALYWIDESRLIVVGHGPNTLITGFGGIQLLDPSGEPLGPPVPFPFDITDTAASHDGRFFAVGRLGGFIDLFTGTGELVSTLTLANAPPAGFTAPTFSADGGLIAASVVGEPTFAVWSTDTLEPLDLPAAATSWTDLRLTGNGLLGTRTNSDLVLVDPYTSEQLSEPLLNPPGRVTYTATDLRNGRLAAAGGDSVRIWDLETGFPLGRELPYQSLCIEYTEDGSLLSVPGGGHVSLWNYETDAWVELACELAGRNLTAEEWRLLGPRSLDHRATCPGYPLR